MAFDIFLTFFLVFLNGFFVASEFAIVKVRATQISIQTGTISKRVAEMIIKNLDGFLAATQLGITISSLGLGWVGEEVMSEMVLQTMSILGFNMSAQLAHRIAFPLAFLLITVMHIVFGELAPKSMAIRYPTATTLWVAVPLRVFYFIFRPFIFILNGFANLILRFFGIKPLVEKEIHSQEELKLIIAESMEGGKIKPSERELIQNVFDFDDRTVKQIMVPYLKISAIQQETSIEDALKYVLREGYSRYPVYDKNIDNIIGIIHAKDLITYYMENAGKSLQEIMRKAYFISENKPIDILLRELQKSKIQIAIVVSEYGGTLGLVSLEDILEELVGEIQDEHDHEVQIVIPISDGFRVIATSSLHDINKFLEVPFAESDEYETLAGLIMHTHSLDLKERNEYAIEKYVVKIIKIEHQLPEMVEIRLIEKNTDKDS